MAPLFSYTNSTFYFQITGSREDRTINLSRQILKTEPFPRPGLPLSWQILAHLSKPRSLSPVLGRLPQARAESRLCSGSCPPPPSHFRQLVRLDCNLSVYCLSPPADSKCLLGQAGDKSISASPSPCLTHFRLDKCELSEWMSISCLPFFRLNIPKHLAAM